MRHTVRFNDNFNTTTTTSKSDVVVNERPLVYHDVNSNSQTSENRFEVCSIDGNE